MVLPKKSNPDIKQLLEQLKPVLEALGNHPIRNYIDRYEK